MLFSHLKFLNRFPRVIYRKYAGVSSIFEQRIRDSCIIPEVIDKLPSDMILVSWLNGSEAKLGNELTPTQTKDTPNTLIWQYETGMGYLLCMTDPDAPSREKPQQREWHHWLVGNINGSNVQGGETLSEYIGPGPPRETGLHRYIFLLYAQRKGFINFREKKLTNKSVEGRANFSIRKFAKKYNLGSPVAINFFVAQYDDYVPILYEKLGA